MKNMWMIYSKTEKDWDTEETLYWSNMDGWVGFESADTFTSEERLAITLPIEGVWKLVTEV